MYMNTGVNIYYMYPTKLMNFHCFRSVQGHLGLIPWILLLPCQSRMYAPLIRFYLTFIYPNILYNQSGSVRWSIKIGIVDFLRERDRLYWAGGSILSHKWEVPNRTP
jgi:hypothetical protein